MTIRSRQINGRNHSVKLTNSTGRLIVRAEHFNDLQQDVADIYDGTAGIGDVFGYNDTITLTEADTTTITTTLTTVPYNIMITDSDGNIITHTVSIKQYLDSGVYKLDIYSSEAVVDAELYILY
jgi:hypothetical protein